MPFLSEIKRLKALHIEAVMNSKQLGDLGRRLENTDKS
jgi:hypothetical protein